MMNKNCDNNKYNNLDNQFPNEKTSEYENTAKIFKKTHLKEIPIKHSAYFEIIGPVEKTVVELGEEEIKIGRSPRCEIQLQVENVSREHAHVFFLNEEYHIEDMNSTNGIYVNGIKIVKCVLRNHDQIDIGGVKLFFNE